MERIDGIVGNVHADAHLADRRDHHDRRGTLERVVLDETARNRSHLRVETDAGTDLGIVVDRPALSAGDVLLRSDDRMIVVALEAREALAVDLPTPTAETTALAVELGHRVGNHHWDLAVEAGTVYVPLAADRHIVERVVADVLPEAACRVTTVDAEVFIEGPRSARGSRDRDHGGSHDHRHGRDHDQGRAHGTDDGHGFGGDHHHHHDHGSESIRERECEGEHGYEYDDTTHD